MLFLQIIPLFMICIIVLMIPGLIANRVMRLSWCNAIVLAPHVSVISYVFICLAAEFLNVSFGEASGLKLLVSATVILALFALLIRKFVLPRVSTKMHLNQKKDAWDVSNNISSIAVLAIFILVAILIGTFIFLRNIGDISNYIQMWDNKTHLATANAFLHSGQFDPFHSYLYNDVTEDAAAPYVKGKNFYPATWHILAASTASFANADITASINALNFTFSFVVFPMGIALFLMRVFTSSNRYILCGSIASLSFVAYPWALLVFGPIYPQLAGFSLLPGVCALTLQLANNFRKRSLGLNILGCIFITVCVAAATAIHPSSFFAFFALMCSYFIWQFSRLPNLFTVRRKNRFSLRILFIAIGLAMVLVLWAFFFNLDFVRHMATANNFDKNSKRTALVNIFTLSLTEYPAQIVVCIFVLIGFFVLVQRKNQIWLCFMYLTAALLYFACSTSNGIFAQFLTGFWYKDMYRVAALLAIAGIPLMTAGLMFILQKLYETVKSEYKYSKVAVLFLFSALVCLSVFWPNFTINGIGSFQTAFSAYVNNVKTNYLPENHWKYTETESDFIDEVKEIIGTDAVVINMPFDGSTYAYSEQDFPVYYRFTVTSYGEENGETPESILIRTKLNEIASNDAVKTAVDSIGAQYVITLDSPSTGQSVRQKNIYDSEKWEGIESLDESTPGFELVLEDNIMRLYRITEAA